MARTFGPRRGARRARNRRNLIIAVAIVVAVLVYYYGFRGEGEREIISDSNYLARSVETTNAIEPANPLTADVSSEETTLGPQVTAPETYVPAPLPDSLIVEPNPAADELITNAQALLDERPSEIIAARDLLDQAMRMPMSIQQRESVKTQLSELAEQWLFSRTVYQDDPLSLCETYQVKPGEILESISKRYKVPYELIMEINSIARPELLQAGARIKVINGPFNVRIYRSTFTMDIYLQNSYVRSYNVGLGLPESETPTGLWRVEQGGKMEHPEYTDKDTNITYYPHDPNNPLGSRWIALEGLEGAAKDREGFGIHGTKDPDKIGAVGSKGCIRMHNGQIIEVYNMLFPAESYVEVTD